MNCPRRHTYWQRKKKLSEKELFEPLFKSSRVREPWRTACHVAHSLRFFGNDLNYWLFLANNIACSDIWSDSGSFPGGTHTSSPSLQAKMDSSVRVSGRLAKTYYKLHLFTLLAPPNSSPSYFSMAVPCSLLRPPVVRQLKQVIIMAFVSGFSQCVS